MAIRKLSEGITGWRSNMPFPKDRYVLHCVEESFGPSSNGNPMITRNWEIVSPNVVQSGDKQLNVGGQQVTQYLTCKVKDDTAKSDKMFGSLRDDLHLLGFKEEEIDDENPPLIAKGKTVEAVVYGKETKSFKSPTPEQRAKGMKVGDPIKTSSGQDVVVYQLQIESILGLAETQINSPF